MTADAFSVSGFYRWNRNDDLHIAQACAEFAQAGTRFLAADAETGGFSGSGAGPAG